MSGIATETPAVGAEPVPGEEEMDRALAELTKAVGHPVRAGIVRFLARREACLFGDLSDWLPLAKSTVSQHLRVLREAGLVCGEVEGSRTCYCIDREGLRRLQRLVASLGPAGQDGNELETGGGA